MVEIFQDEAGGWRYRVKGRNGEILVTSESYTRKEDAARGYTALATLIEKRPQVIIIEDFI